MDKRGWVVWTWGKMGSLLVFMGMMLMLLTAYSFTSSTAQADGASRVSRDIRNLILDTYNSAGGMAFEYELPGGIGGEDYSIRVVDADGTAGIITNTTSGSRAVLGGATLAVPLSAGSYGTLKGFGDDITHLCMVKHGGIVYLERSKCS